MVEEAEVAAAEEVAEVDEVDEAAVVKDNLVARAVDNAKEPTYPSIVGHMVPAVIPVGSANVLTKDINIKRPLITKWTVRHFIVHHDKSGAVLRIYYIN